jgi:crotonobetaine/carnitine-CoA ligase
MRDEVPIGFVVQQPGRPALDGAELAAWCEARLAKSKRPARIEIVGELPRTSVGKIRKFLLKAPA